MYKLLSNPITNQEIDTILRIADSAYIPKDTGNSDYQKYLEWLAKGNTPLPADTLSVEDK